jgi:tetratricopeptide (TPR) repeat protein
MAQEKPKKPLQLYEEADGLYSQGKYSEALALLDQCLKINPGFMDAYPLRASTREQLKDLDGALTDYSIFLEKYPDNPDVLMSRAMLRYNIGFFDQAKEDFRRMLNLTTQETNAIFFRQNMSVDDRAPAMTTTDYSHTAIVFNYLGLIELKTKNPRSAITYLDTAIRLDPKEADFYVNRGLAKESLDDSTAFIDYELALRLNPNHTLARHNLEAFNAKHGKQMSDEDRLTKTIEVDSTMLLPYLERAQQRYEGGYYKGALEDYNQALALDPQNIEVLFARGLTKEKLKDYEGAFSDYTKAIDRKENYTKAWLSRGNVLLKLERYADAIDDYTVALIYQPDYPHAYHNRGVARLKLKKNAEACADFTQAESLGMKVDAKLKSKACDSR